MDRLTTWQKSKIDWLARALGWPMPAVLTWLAAWALAWALRAAGAPLWTCLGLPTALGVLAALWPAVAESFARIEHSLQQVAEPRVDDRDQGGRRQGLAQGRQQGIDGQGVHGLSTAGRRL